MVWVAVVVDVAGEVEQVPGHQPATAGTGRKAELKTRSVATKYGSRLVLEVQQEFECDVEESQESVQTTCGEVTETGTEVGAHRLKNVRVEKT